MNRTNPPPKLLPPAMSEFDSYSDSDWLDISSNRESDTDSVISADSDREDIGRGPLSRRSSISIGSSREGDIEAWEGFVSDSGDEETPDKRLEGTVATLAADGDKQAGTLGDSNDQHNADDERVREGLDQSLISTLSASRSSTASAHSSIRDLRLSFPDPLTSSRDELNRCYVDSCPSDTAFTSTDVPTDVGEVTDEATMERQSSSDRGYISTPGVVEQVVQHEVKGNTKPEVQVVAREKAEFDIVLYGSSSSIKWSFVKSLVQKAVAISGRTVTGSTVCVGKHVMYLYIERYVDRTLSIRESVTVYDRTDEAMGTDVRVFQDPKRPSLAILYLPSPVNSLPEHTLYLPVLVPSASSTLGRITAQSDWDSIVIPRNRIVRLTKDVDSVMYNSANIEDLPQLRAHRLIERLASEGKRRSTKVIAEQFRPRHTRAVTLFALVSIVVGFAMNTTFRKPYVSTPTGTTTSPSTTLLGMFGPEINRTAISPASTTARVNIPVVTSYDKDFSLSLYDPGTTSLAVTPSHSKALDVITNITPRTAFSKTEEKNKATDVIVRSTSKLSAVKPQPSMPMTPPDRTAGPSKAKTTAGSLTSVVDSITEVLDISVKSLRHDLDELVVSLDELSRAVQRQTKAKMQQSKVKAREIREKVQYRHERAKSRAKELKKAGEDAASSATGHLTERKDLAKKKAREITDSLATSDAWRVYQGAQVEWAARLKKKGGGSGNKGGGEKAWTQKGSWKGGCQSGHKLERKETNFFFSYDFLA